MGVPRVRLTKSWIAAEPDGQLGSDIGDAIFQFGMTPAQNLPAPTADHPSTSFELWGGSQRSMWLFGALFVQRSTLPRTGILVRTLQFGDKHIERVELRLEDNIGFGLMDPVTAARFRSLFKEIAATLEKTLRANSADVTDAPS